MINYNCYIQQMNYWVYESNSYEYYVERITSFIIYLVHVLDSCIHRLQFFFFHKMFWKAKRNFNFVLKFTCEQNCLIMSHSYNRNVNVFMVSISEIVKGRTMLHLDSMNSYVNFVKKNKKIYKAYTFTALYWNNKSFEFSPTI